MTMHAKTTIADPADWTTEASARHHCDALADTGDGYTQFKGWVLTCLWCDFDCRGLSKKEALSKMDAHFDDLHQILLATERAATKG